MAPVIVFFATAWGPAYGGINCLNAEFAVALAQLGAQVVCVVPGSTSTAAVRSAEAKGIRLLAIGNEAEFEGKALLAERVIAGLQEAKIRPDVLVGHDVITGPLAIACKPATGAQLAIVHHMHYLAYKSLEASGEHTDVKDRQQQEVLGSADLVIAVGPLLADSAADLLRPCGDKGPPIHTLIPGLAAVEPVGAPHQFGVFFAGRLSGVNRRVFGSGGRRPIGSGLSTGRAASGSLRSG